MLAPLAEVAEAAQHIGETDDLTGRIRVHADDEVGQLATRFNTMLDRLEGSRAALDESVRAQRQLVADASHELRTPVTSLRTNIEVLLAGGRARPGGPPPAARRRRRAERGADRAGHRPDRAGARRRARSARPRTCGLDRVAEECVARARRNAPGVVFKSTLAPVILDGVAERLERAINNLLDNAARHSPSGGTVEVTVDSDGRPRPRSRPGRRRGRTCPTCSTASSAAPTHAGSQGSGLGLAIVRQVTEQHGGTVSAANAPDGGAIFTMKLPVIPAPPDPTEPSATHWEPARSS